MSAGKAGICCPCDMKGPKPSDLQRGKGEASAGAKRKLSYGLGRGKTNKHSGTQTRAKDKSQRAEERASRSVRLRASDQKGSSWAGCVGHIPPPGAPETWPGPSAGQPSRSVGEVALG